MLRGVHVELSNSIGLIGLILLPFIFLSKTVEEVLWITVLFVVSTEN